MNRCLALGMCVFALAGSLQPEMATAQTELAQGKKKVNAEAPKADQERYWTTRWEFEDVDIDKLASRLGALGIELGVEVRGNVTVEFDVGVPLTSLTDGAAYRFDGTLKSPRLTVENVELRELETQVRYRNGVATLARLKSQVIDSSQAGSGPGVSGQVAIGELQGDGTVELLPKGDVNAKLDVKDISLAPLSELISKFSSSQSKTLPQDGTLSGEIQFRAPLEKISQIETYELTGNAKVQRLKLADLPPANVDIGGVSIHEGRLRLSELDLRASSEGSGQSEIRLLGKADVPLSGVGEISFELAADDLPLGKVSSMMASNLVDGKVDFHLRGTGLLASDIKDSTWTVSGPIGSPAITVVGTNIGVLEHEVTFTPERFDLVPRRRVKSLPSSFKVQEIRSQYQISETALTIKSLVAKAFDGQVSGTATLPRGEQGDVVADLAIDHMRPEVKLPTSRSLAATITGKVQWRVPIAELASPRSHSGTGTLTAADISLDERAVGDLKANLAADRGNISLQADGELFGGTVGVKTLAVMESDDRWLDVPRRLRPLALQFDTVSIKQFLDQLVAGAPRVTGKVSGEIVVDLPAWNQQRSVIPPTSISIELSNMKQRSLFLSRSVRLDARLQSDIFVIDKFVGDYAGGSARLTGQATLFDSEDAFHPRADFQIAATRINLARGLWFFGDAADQLAGNASASAMVSGYQESIRFRGNIDGRELAAYGLPIGTAHSGWMATFDLQTLRWSLDLPTVRSRVGGGQLNGELALSSGNRGGVDLSSRWKTRRVDFFRLTNELGRSSKLAKGEISGELTLGGKSVKSVNDLAGRFNFQLGQTRGAAIPGLIAASQFLGPVSLAGESFDVGNVKGIIGSGAVTIDEFWLGSDNALVQADGKVFLPSGRMDLNALIATGNYRDIAGNLNQLTQKYALRSILPASAIFSITDLLRDRTLVLSVRGTPQNPILRLQPIETFREEAARFLLREGRRLILAGVTSGAIDGLDGGF